MELPAHTVNASHGPVLAASGQLVSWDLRYHLPAGGDVEIGMAQESSNLVHMTQGNTKIFVAFILITLDHSCIQMNSNTTLLGSSGYRCDQEAGIHLHDLKWHIMSHDIPNHISIHACTRTCMQTLTHVNISTAFGLQTLNRIGIKGFAFPSSHASQ